MKIIYDLNRHITFCIANITCIKGGKHIMNNNIDYTERAYATSEVATMLDIAVPTVRKYAQTLERNGYVFLKTQKTGKQQSRMFVESDITALRYLKDIREKGSTTVEQASSIVIERFGKGAIQGITDSDTTEIKQYEEQYTNENIVNMIEQQNELIKQLTEKLDKQQTYIENSLNERDRNLMESINQSLEKQKQIATIENEKKQGIWKRLFKGKK